MDSLSRQERILTRIENILSVSTSQGETTELTLIVRKLEMMGKKVSNIYYHNETCLATVSGFQYQFGLVGGLTYGNCWFFGNIGIVLRMAGVIVLTNENDFAYTFSSTLVGEDVATARGRIGVNNGLNLLGNGNYEGTKKIYQVGFNWFGMLALGIGAATFQMIVDFNGYVFKLQ